MKILSLKSENIKRLSIVEINPEGNLVIIAGANESGKSSVLDSIVMAMTGKDSFPPMPVREGQEKATIDIDLGELKVTRTITSNGGGTLTVRKEGVKQPSPQAILDGLYGKLTFDPEGFRKQRPPEQAETLRVVVGLDFSGIDKQYDVLFSERTNVNRDVAQLEARIKSASHYPDVTTDLETSKTSILEAQQASISKNQANFNIKNHAKDSASGLVRAEAQLDESSKQVENLKTLLLQAEHLLETRKQTVIQLKTEVDEWNQKVKSLADDDMQQYVKLLSTADEINSKIIANREYNKLRQAWTDKKSESEELTFLLNKIETSKREMLESANWPVPGLSLHEGKEVRFNGIPFQQCSTAQQLKVSVAMGIVMNPKLRILLIRQGNDLDQNNLKLVADMACKHDMQIWIERVSTDGDVAVVMEDGRVAV